MARSFAHGDINKLPILKVTKIKIYNEKNNFNNTKRIYYFTSKYNGKIYLSHHTKTPH